MNKLLIILLLSLLLTPISVMAPHGSAGSVRGKNVMKITNLTTDVIAANGTQIPLHFQAVYSTDDSAWYTEASKDLRYELFILDNWTETVYVEIFWFECITFDSDKNENGINYYSDGYWMESTIASPYIDYAHNYQAHVMLPSAYISDIIITRYGGGTYEKQFDGTVVSLEVTLLIGNGTNNYQRMLFDRFLIKDGTTLDSGINPATINQSVETSMFGSGFELVIGSIAIITLAILHKRFRQV